MRGLLNLLGIGRVTVVDDAGDLQLLQVTEGAIGTGRGDRVTDQVRRVTEFGFSSSPPLGAEVVVIRRNGERAQSIAIATSHRPSRPRDLSPGDVVVYDVRGRMIRLTEEGIEVEAAGGPVTIRDAAKVRCECDVETTGDVTARVDGKRVSLAKLYDAYQFHSHPPVTAGASWGSGPPVPKA